MKWVNHKLVTGAVVYAAVGNPLAVIPAMVGSIFPDMVEGTSGFGDRARMSSWRKRHRKASHWFLPYLLGACAIAFLYLPAEAFRPGWYPFQQGNTVMDAIPFAGFYFLVGCLMHLLQDMPCGKIPSINPGSRVGMHLFKVGSFAEYVVVFGILVLCLIASGLIRPA